MSNTIFGLTGKAAIIFGGTSGINLGIAKRYVESGAGVFVVSRKQENVDAATAALQAVASGAPGEVLGGCTADVRDVDAVRLAVEAAASKAGGLDIVISGAAGNFLCPAEELSSNGFRTVVDIDLIGTFNVASASFPHLNLPGANIIAISAPQGAKPVHGQVHACAAKAGVNMLTKCLAMEWGPKGVRVNAISPGPIGDTEGMKRLAESDDAATRLASSLSLGRYGTIEEIADAACFLASPQAEYINGIVLDVDGGAMLGTGQIV